MIHMPAMTTARKILIAVIGLRVAYGAALVAAPARLTRGWLGAPADQPGTQVATRGLGVRETLLHVGALVAARRDAPLRPWLAASIAGDLTDITATFVARRSLPRRSVPATAAVAGGSA